MSKRDAKYQLCSLVEIDEAYFCGPDENSKRGRGSGKAKVIVAVSLSDKGKPEFATMHVVKQLNQDTVHDFAAQKIAEGAHIKSDGLNIYSKLSTKGYSHISKTTKNTDPCDFLPWVDTLISNAKAFIEGTYHGLDRKHLQAYLHEFCYRFNRRFWEHQLFGRLLNACLASGTKTFAELTQ